MDQNNSNWPFKTNEPNFKFELILWKLETLHVNVSKEHRSVYWKVLYLQRIQQNLDLNLYNFSQKKYTLSTPYDFPNSATFEELLKIVHVSFNISSYDHAIA